MTLLNDTGYLFVRSLKKLARTPVLILISLFQPIIFLVLFTQLFDKFSQVPGLFPPGVNYLNYAVPGILLMTAFTSALQSATSLVNDLNSGFLQKMLVTPVSRPAILLGRLSTDVVRIVIQTIIVLALAYAMGFTVDTGISGILVIFLTIAFFGLAFSGISLAIGLATRSGEAAYSIGAFLLFPLLFMSTAFVPTQAMPSWIQSVSSINPISFVVDAIRDLSLPDQYSLGTILSAWGVVAIIAVVSLGATLYLFRKVVR
jgi:ABC-2 type transport system permease protein